MRIVFTSYVKTDAFSDPVKWLDRIKGYAGIVEALGNYYEVISIEQINYDGELEKNSVKYYFKNFNGDNHFFPSHQHKFIKSLQADIIVVHGMHFPKHVMQLRKAVGKTAKIILQNHAEKPFRWPKSYWQKLADKTINAYMFTAVEMAEDWISKKIISKEKVWGIMEASSAFSPINKADAKRKIDVSGNPVFLFVGRLDKNKDPIKVITSFLQYNQQQPSSKLYMLYHTTELLNEVKKILVEFDYNKSIELIGNRPHAEMQYWFSAADYIISASHAEAGGVAVCEGMSCGCIPVLTSIAPFKKVTAQGSCGILYNENEKHALVEALIKTQYLNIDEERKKVLQQFQDDLSFSAIARQMHDKMKSL